MLKLAPILFIAYVGYALGKSDLRIRPALTAVTVLVAMMLHGLVQIALPHEDIERIAAVVARSSQSPTLVVVAIVETAGIWISALLIHWAVLRTRIWAAAYIMGAATVGGFLYYRGFDAPPVPHPEYEAWLVWALILAIIPFAVGFIAHRRQRRSAASQLTAS